MNEFYTSLIYLALLFLIWLFTYKKKLPILLLYPVAINSYSLIYTGLKWIDIAAILWIFLAIYYVKKIGIMSLFFLNMISLQLLIDLLLFTMGSMTGEIWDILVTPVHAYTPLLLLILLVENRPLDALFIWKKFNKIVPLMLIAIFFISFFIQGSQISSLKQISGVSATAVFVASIFPTWLAFFSKNHTKRTIISTFIISFLFLIMSQTRGAIIIFLVMSLLVIIIVNNKNIIFKLFILLFLTILPILIGYFDLIKYTPDKFISIINLYTSLFSNDLDTSKVNSGEFVRWYLWTGALKVWVENLWIGLGNGQFGLLRVIPGRDVALSPHHVILSIAVDGGLVMVLANFLPQLYITYKTFLKKELEKRLFFYLSISHIIMSFSLGYSYNFIIIIILYISLKAREKHNA